MEGVGDGVAAVAPEVAGAELDAGRGLAALVLGAEQLAFDVGDDGAKRVTVMAFRLVASTDGG